jgi:hypothetical protein
VFLGAITTTYNRPDAWAAVLDGYSVQNSRQCEVVFAEDGSTAEPRAGDCRLSPSKTRCLHLVSH